MRIYRILLALTLSTFVLMSCEKNRSDDDINDGKSELEGIWTWTLSSSEMFYESSITFEGNNFSTETGMAMPISSEVLRISAFNGTFVIEGSTVILLTDEA